MTGVRDIVNQNRNDWLNFRSVLTDARAAKIDNLDAKISTRAPANTALSNAVWTNARAGYLDKINTMIDAKVSEAVAKAEAARVAAEAAKTAANNATNNSLTGVAMARKMVYRKVGNYTFKVPAGCTQIYVEACAAGNDGTMTSGGAGGQCMAEIMAVTAGSNLSIQLLSTGNVVIGSTTLYKGKGAAAGQGSIFASGGSGQSGGGGGGYGGGGGSGTVSEIINTDGGDGIGGAGGYGGKGFTRSGIGGAGGAKGGYGGTSTSDAGGGGGAYGAGGGAPAVSSTTGGNAPGKGGPAIVVVYY